MATIVRQATGGVGPCTARAAAAARLQQAPYCIHARALEAWQPRPGGRRGTVCRGFLSGLFGGGGGGGSALADQADAAGPGEDHSGEDLDQVLLTELQRDDGSRGYIVYRNGTVVDAAELEQLCDKVGWPRRPQNKVQAALANSFLVATLTLEEAPPGSSGSAAVAAGTRGRLIGLARCTSDGAFNATLWDVLVDPEFQGQGLGKALVEGVTRTLLKRDITNITLFADGAVVNFYSQLGYAADPEGIKGMFWHPRF